MRSFKREGRRVGAVGTIGVFLLSLLGCGDGGDWEEYEHLFEETDSEEVAGDDDDDDDVGDFDTWRDGLPQQDLSFSFGEVVMVPSDVGSAYWFAPSSDGACIVSGTGTPADDVYCVDEMGNIESIHGLSNVEGAANENGSFFVLTTAGNVASMEDVETLYEGDLTGLGSGEGSLWGVDRDLRLLRLSSTNGHVLDNVPLPAELDSHFAIYPGRIGVAVDDNDLWLSFSAQVGGLEGRWLSLLSADLEIQGVWKLVMSESGDDLSFYGLAYRNGDLWFAIGDSIAIRRLTWE